LLYGVVDNASATAPDFGGARPRERNPSPGNPAVQQGIQQANAAPIPGLEYAPPPNPQQEVIPAPPPVLQPRLGGEIVNVRERKTYFSIITCKWHPSIQIHTMDKTPFSIVRRLPYQVIHVLLTFPS
jgi:hypothetical protein